MNENYTGQFPDLTLYHHPTTPTPDMLPRQLLVGTRGPVSCSSSIEALSGVHQRDHPAGARM